MTGRYEITAVTTDTGESLWQVYDLTADHEVAMFRREIEARTYVLAVTPAATDLPTTQS